MRQRSHVFALQRHHRDSSASTRNRSSGPRRASTLSGARKG